MNIRIVRLTLMCLVVFFISVPPCWAKTKGYLYVVGYSLSEKKVFYSPVIMYKIPNKSFNDEEYITDVELIRAMEAQFEKYLTREQNINKEAYTISTRGAYKKKEIAEKLMENEKNTYLNKGYLMSEQKAFVYED